LARNWRSEVQVRVRRGRVSLWVPVESPDLGVIDGQRIGGSGGRHAVWAKTNALDRECAATGDRFGEFPGSGLHNLRHYYASLLIRHGEGVKTVQVRLGRASAVETLDTYSHPVAGLGRPDS
jgi:integrase